MLVVKKGPSWFYHFCIKKGSVTTYPQAQTNKQTNKLLYNFQILKCGSRLSSETTAILRDQANLWPGTYKVAVEVKDQQGKSCDAVQMIDVTVCNCDDVTKNCLSRETKTAGFGASGILLLLLGLLLLLCE